MRAVIDLASNRILGTEATPDVGQSSVVNGKYVFPIPEGAAVVVDSSTVVFPQADPNSLTTQAAAGLLVRYPMFSNILYNALIEDADVSAFDITATGPGGVISRAMIGRAPPGAPPQPGISPNNTVILPQNNGATAPRLGCLVTDAITSIPGADEAMLWWSVAFLDTTEDVNHGYLTTAGVDTPAYRTLTETDQEPAALSVYLSNDNGSTWEEATRLIPTDLSATGFGDTKATATATVLVSPVAAGTILAIGGLPLTSVAGPRTSGSNNFNGSAGSVAAIAADIIAAITDPNNVFTSLCTAASGGGGVINLTAAPLGSLGNAITLTTSHPLRISVSGANFVGGVNADFRIAFTNTSSSRGYLLAYALLW
jgi:hypothetical protein